MTKSLLTWLVTSLQTIVWRVLTWETTMTTWSIRFSQGLRLSYPNWDYSRARVNQALCIAMSLWVDKHRPTMLSKLDYHKKQAASLKKLVGYHKITLRMKLLLFSTHPESGTKWRFPSSSCVWAIRFRQKDTYYVCFTRALWQWSRET